LKGTVRNIVKDDRTLEPKATVNDSMSNRFEWRTRSGKCQHGVPDRLQVRVLDCCGGNRSITTVEHTHFETARADIDDEEVHGVLTGITVDRSFDGVVLNTKDMK
jgi:hypothetical protein